MSAFRIGKRVLMPALVAAAAVGCLALFGGTGNHGTEAGAAAMARAPGNKPHIIQKRIPFPKKRKRQMAKYSKRHYGQFTSKLKHPHVIVEHYAEAGSVSAVYNTFAPDTRDPELHELPNVCAHFVVGSNGKIYQLVSLKIRCRHTVGLNWTAIGIEHVGFSDKQILHNKRQMRASLKLTRWLRCTRGIKGHDVIGHAESLSSRFHRERVKSLKHQTHSDWKHRDMVRYRHRLAKVKCG